MSEIYQATKTMTVCRHLVEQTLRATKPAFASDALRLAAEIEHRLKVIEDSIHGNREHFTSATPFQMFCATVRWANEMLTYR